MSRADQYRPLSDELQERWGKFGAWDREFYPTLLGLVVEEVRHDYCRMRLPFKPSLEQAAGVVHGGAIASALDHVVVPAVGSAYTSEHRYSTVDMHVQYLSALIGEDAVVEGWVVKRGRTTVFCESELRGAASGKLIARSVLTYNVSAITP
ncbi:MAG: PaaI family thioesterase [Ilumatobacteraceae bacterium]|jgi:uncharacterized protein (TIGR00369 family)